MEFKDFGISFVELFLDPKKRIYFGYLFCSLIIAFGWLKICKKLSLIESFRKVFDKKIFFSKSSKSDVKIYIINRAFTFFISPLLLTQLIVATFLFNLLLNIDWLSPASGYAVSKTFVVLSYTAFVFLLDDFTKYFVHRWMHKFPILWALHKVHHTAEQLTPITIFRTHPLEGVVFSLRSAFAQGLAISFFFYFFGSSVSLVTVLGANVLVFAFNVCGSNLRHSHIGIRYWSWLEYILISPAQHQLHHSIAEEHYDKNFGATLAIWDWIFGSLHHSIETDELVLGVKDENVDDHQSMYSLYILPVIEMSKVSKDFIYSAINYLFEINQKTKRKNNT